MKLLSPRLWFKQARADAKASAAGHDLAECHRRYLLQQAYEKAVKALALANLPKRLDADRQFASALGDYLLMHHTPWTVFSGKNDEEWRNELRGAYAARWSELLRKLKELRRNVAIQLQRDTDARIVEVWKQIDSTRPSRSVDEVSYRYPFVVDEQSDGIAPVDWDGWSQYQGAEELVRSAIEELLQRAGRQVTIWEQST